MLRAERRNERLVCIHPEEFVAPAKILSSGHLDHDILL
jgi:hypothetical protein